MQQITKAAFIATVGQLDVSPYPRSGRYDDKWGYKMDWKLRNGVKVGLSDGGTTFEPDRYFVTDEFYASHRAEIEKFPVQHVKRLNYEYAGTEAATRLGFAETGCWTVEVGREDRLLEVIAGWATKAA